MPEGTVTLEQDQWADEYLRLLGEGSEPELEDLKGEFFGNSDNDLGEPENINRYGKGYKQADERELPQALKNALANGTMPSASDWNKASMEPSEQEKNDFANEKGTIPSKLARFPELRTEWEALDGKLTKLRIAAQNGYPWPCPIGPPEGDIEAVNLQSMWTQIQGERNAKGNEIAVLREAGKKCMPLIDTPANNPERKKVGKVLADLESIDKLLAENKITGEAHSQAKCKKLNELQKELFAWNDRRAKGSIPPSAESLAMGDLLQQEHQKLTADIVKNKWPIVVADEDKLSKEEKAHVQEVWANLRDDTEKARQGKATSGKLAVAPTKVDPPVATDEDLEKFRIAKLSDFMRLMGTDVGRDCIDKINTEGHKVEIAPTTEQNGDGCGSWGQVYRTQGGRQGGGRSQVNLVFGAKDSDNAMRTVEGNELTDPTFVILGHELIHAMHNSRGSNRTYLPLPQGVTAEKWSDLEEYRTIFESKTSERTIRDQLGMSAVRFGHSSTHPGQQVGDAYKSEIDAVDELDKIAVEAKKPNNKVVAVDDALSKRRWNPDDLGNKLKLALYKDETLFGPLPDGWDANRLTIDQLKAVLRDRLPARLEDLGWTPENIADPVKMKTVIVNYEHAASSPLGRRFASLGGKEALDAITSFNNATGAKLSVGSDTYWPSKVLALDEAKEWLEAYASEKNDPILNPIVNDRSNKLTAKLNGAANILAGSIDPALNARLALDRIKQLCADHMNREEWRKTYGDPSELNYIRILADIRHLVEGVKQVKGPNPDPKEFRGCVHDVTALINTCQWVINNWIDKKEPDDVRNMIGGQRVDSVGLPIPSSETKQQFKRDVLRVHDAAVRVKAVLDKLTG